MASASEAIGRLGWDEGWEELRRASGVDGEPARVARLDRGSATVWSDDGEARIRTAGADVAVGDWVLVVSDGDERVGVVLERRSAFVRRAAGAAAGQVVAANVDVAALLHALTGRVSARRLERELVLAFESGAEPLVVLTKADIGKDVAGAVAAAEAVAPDVPVLVVSATTGQGVDELSARAGGRTVALLGASGVGKSTLVNALVGADVQRVGHLRADQKGRHTTTAAALIRLGDTGLLMDTPGLRSLGLWSDGEGLDRAFADIATLALECRFPNCRHDSEPGCAVRDVVDPVRVDAYRRLRAELDALEQELARPRRNR